MRRYRLSWVPSSRSFESKLNAWTGFFGRLMKLLLVGLKVIIYLLLIECGCGKF